MQMKKLFYRALFAGVLSFLAGCASETLPETLPEIEPALPAQESTFTLKPTANGYDNLSLGTPKKMDFVIDRRGFALGYSCRDKQSSWVTYRLTEAEATTKAAARSNKFQPDPLITRGSATLADYRRSGYDRGHLAPAADMAYSVQTMNESFYLSNISPQKPDFNRGIWKDLEAQVRYFAIVEKDIYVVTGPILPKTPGITIGASQVTVPKYYYKVIYDLTPPEKMIGFILPNAGSNRKLQDFAVTVDQVEEVTGLDFFNLLPQARQKKLESTISVDAWKWLNFKK